MAVIYVAVKTVYGNDLTYVVGPAGAAEFIQTLTHKKTVNSHDVEALRGLGFEVKYR